jgi:hypothetical protein
MAKEVISSNDKLIIFMENMIISADSTDMDPGRRAWFKKKQKLIQDRA